MVSIIILSFNTSKLLHDCLESVQAALKGFDYELIVVDNLSSDDSVEMVKKSFKDVRLIENTENAGFAKGCNLGAKHAKGKYLLFLNSDTEMKENPLPSLIENFEKNEKVGIVGGALKNFDGSAQRSFGKFYGLSQVTLMLFGGEKAELTVQNIDKVQKVDWVSGGFMMARKDIFDSIHGFDEHFFMYIEDMELCYRVKKKGYIVMHEPKGIVAHLGQGSSNKGFAIIHIFKGLRYFYKKHRSALSYNALVGLLTLKADLVIFLALLQNKKELVETYKKALA